MAAPSPFEAMSRSWTSSSPPAWSELGGRRLAVYVMLSRSGRPSSPEPAKGPAPSLTEREREVVTAIALGQETPGIAEELYISQETVRTHVRNAMSKLGNAYTRPTGCAGPQ